MGGMRERRRMEPGSVLDITASARHVRTGDLFVFRGTSGADRVIRTVTNAPVNHVGMALVVDELPPLLWHAELGRSLVDVWSGTTHRGAQLHVLTDAVRTWELRYGQQGWLRQLDGPVGAAMEDAALRTVARLDGTPFPRIATMARRWAAGRLRRDAGVEELFCAEVVASTLIAMDLLPARPPANTYSPGSFWSGTRLELAAPFRYGEEIAVR
jgi:hypothetical protein